jgi:hypothetical protein
MKSLMRLNFKNLYNTFGAPFIHYSENFSFILNLDEQELKNGEYRKQHVLHLYDIQINEKRYLPSCFFATSFDDTNLVHIYKNPNSTKRYMIAITEDLKDVCAPFGKFINEDRFDNLFVVFDSYNDALECIYAIIKNNNITYIEN